jgi:hypothetical protein
MGCSLLSTVEILYFLTNSLISAGSKYCTRKSPKVWAAKRRSELKVANLIQIDTLTSKIALLENRIQEIEKENCALKQRIEAIEEISLAENLERK